VAGLLHDGNIGAVVTRPHCDVGTGATAADHDVSLDGAAAVGAGNRGGEYRDSHRLEGSAKFSAQQCWRELRRLQCTWAMQTQKRKGLPVERTAAEKRGRSEQGRVQGGSGNKHLVFLPLPVSSSTNSDGSLLRLCSLGGLKDEFTLSYYI
jgi:hypothetical protein